MPTETIQPAAEGYVRDWVILAGSGKVVAVQAPDDDDTSAIRGLPGIICDQAYTLTSNAIPVGAVINSVSVYTRCARYASASTIATGLYLSGVLSSGPDQALPVAYTSYTDVISRPGGGAWAVSDLASVQVVIQQKTANRSRCTSLWVIVNYTPPPSAFFHLFP